MCEVSYSVVKEEPQDNLHCDQLAFINTNVIDIDDASEFCRINM